MIFVKKFEMRKYFHVLESDFFYLKYVNISVFIKGKNIGID